LGSDWCNGLLSQEERALYMSTMLVVREQPAQCSTHAPSDRKLAETGRIIGSAVCVLIEPTWGHDHGLSSDLSSDNYTNREQQCLMRLV